MEFLKQLFKHGFEESNTGGGCTALTYTYDDGAYLMLTQDAQVPVIGEQITVGFYDADGALVWDYGNFDYLTCAFIKDKIVPADFYQTLDALSEEWNKFLVDNKLPKADAEELLIMIHDKLDCFQLFYVRKFISRWDYLQTWTKKPEKRIVRVMPHMDFAVPSFRKEKYDDTYIRAFEMLKALPADTVKKLVLDGLQDAWAYPEDFAEVID